MTTDARRELLTTGQLGPVGLDLLYRTAYAVARGRNFPPPEGHTIWDRSAVEALAHETLAGPRGLKRLKDLLVSSTDEESFERLLRGTVLNVLRDRGRATDFGALVVRVTEVLDQSSAFRRVAVGSRLWTLADGADNPSAVPDEQLAKAAAGISDIHVPRWSSATRRAPAADFDSFERILTAVLVRAGGGVSAADLARACLARLDPAYVPLTVALNVLESTVPEASLGTEDATLTRIVGLELFNTLNDRERLILATSDRTVRDAAQAIGLGHTQAGTLRTELANHLKAMLQTEPTRRQDATS
jgi:hypothetical protein